MKRYYFSVIKFPLMVSLGLILVIMLFFGISLSSYFRLGLSLSETVIYTVLFIALVILVSSWILNLIGTHNKIKPSWMASYAKWMLTHVYFYLARIMAFITLQKRSGVQESFLHFNNEVVLSAAKGKNFERVLLLLPHCLQDSECQIRITTDINACASCGRCDIAELKSMAGKYGVAAAVATGGSLARKIIKDTHPQMIVAVACHRDLTEGVRDAWSFPVYAVLNQRPNGPCFNTTVSLKSIEYAIRKFRSSGLQNS